MKPRALQRWVVVVTSTALLAAGSFLALRSGAGGQPSTAPTSAIRTDRPVVADVATSTPSATSTSVAAPAADPVAKPGPAPVGAATRPAAVAAPTRASEDDDREKVQPELREEDSEDEDQERKQSD